MCRLKLRVNPGQLTGESRSEFVTPKFLIKFSQRLKFKFIVYLLIVLNFIFIAVLLGPQGAYLGGYIAPIFLFLVPGCSLLLFLWKANSNLALSIVKSFIFSISFTFLLSTLIGVSFGSIDRVTLIFIIFLWNLSCQVIALKLNKIRMNEVLAIRRETVLCCTIWLILFLVAASFALSNIHSPTPDEAYTVRQGRQFYLQTSDYLSSELNLSSNKIPLISFMLSRPLHTVSVSLTMMVANVGSTAAYTFGAFEVSMFVFAIYACAELISGSRKIALLSAFFIALNPVILQVGVGVLTDVSVALYLLIGYVFYARALVWNDTGQITRLDGMSLLLSAGALLCAFLVKLPTFIFFFGIIFLHFLHVLFKSKKVYERGFRLFKVLSVALVAYLSIDLYYVLGQYFMQNLPGISVVRQFLLVDFSEYTLQLFYPSAYSSANGVLSLFNATPAYVSERLYLAILSPNYFTFGIFFLFLAGLIGILGLKRGPDKSYLVFTLMLFLIPVLMALLRPTYELARQGIFLYPFVTVVAAYGLFSYLSKKRSAAFYLAVCSIYVAFVLITEYLMLVDFHAILGGILAVYLYIPTVLLLLPCLVIPLLKAKPILSIDRFRVYSDNKYLGKIKHAIIKVHLAEWIIIGVIFFSSFYLTRNFSEASYRHQLSPVYTHAAQWIDSHSTQGEVIMSNTFFLDYFLEDAVFLKVNVTTLPSDYQNFIDAMGNVTYVVLFTTEVKPSNWEADIPYGSQYAPIVFANPPGDLKVAYQYPEVDPIVRILIHNS